MKTLWKVLTFLAPWLMVGALVLFVQLNLDRLPARLHHSMSRGTNIVARDHWLALVGVPAGILAAVATIAAGAAASALSGKPEAGRASTWRGLTGVTCTLTLLAVWPGLVDTIYQMDQPGPRSSVVSLLVPLVLLVWLIVVRVRARGATARD